MTDRDPIDVHLGGVLREGRLHKRMTLEELGAALGVTYQQVQKYESGYNRISAATLWRLTGILDTPVDHFFPKARSGARAHTASMDLDLETGNALTRIPAAKVRQALRNLIVALGEDVARAQR
jgi:transcriptional regulator with XRE-family HTH domain